MSWGAYPYIRIKDEWWFESGPLEFFVWSNSTSSLSSCYLFYPFEMTMSIKKSHTLFSLLFALSSVLATPTPGVKPITLKLESRKVAPGSRPQIRKRASLSPSSVPLADYFNGTDLQCVFPSFFSS